MPITQSLSSKSNISKRTTNDLPFSPAQPVISRFEATSTANQTVINLTFSVDTTSTDIFFLFVNGQKLKIGSANDYTFTAIGADLTSSQVTLNSSIVFGLNIEAFKLGLKKESEFQTDNRFVAAYDYLDQSFQAFVSQNTLRTATATTGSPAAGSFYSTVVNRAAMVDLSQDLKPRMGIDRLMVEQIYQLQNEFGPNGETVSAAANDLFGQIRFVGGWSNNLFSYGSALTWTSSGSDYAEVTFYGTGLNILSHVNNIVATYSVSVDGGAYGSNIYPSTASSFLNARNYATNMPLNAVFGLALGLHTVSIKFGGSGNYLYGFEILNESSLIKVNPGVSYYKGQKYVSSALQSFSYSAPVTGTRGGRVLTYQTSTGAIGQAFQAVDSTALYLTAASHTNEEMVRAYSFREFGAGRADDFSSLVNSASNRAFTLDDGTTTLNGFNVGAFSGSGGQDALYGVGSTSVITVTFVGTGLDIDQDNFSTSSAVTVNVSVDGSAAGSFSLLASGEPRRVRKIVSGLPYGTHTVKFTPSTATNGPTIYKFLIYQPKKPSVPTGAVELADYNVMASYVGATGGQASGPSQGVILKSPARESLYVGTSWSIVLNTGQLTGFYTSTTNNTDFDQYTFFGTGIEAYVSYNSTANTFILQIDGTSPSTGVTVTNGGSYSAGVVTMAGGGNIVQVTGLSAGLHTIKLIKNSATDQLQIMAMGIITPIHSAKFNLVADLQNTLLVGSCGISDNRKTTPIKDVLPVTKAWVQAIGITSSPTTGSTSFAPVPDMSLEIRTSGGAINIEYAISTSNTGSSSTGNLFQIYVDGIAVGNQKVFNSISVNSVVNISDNIIVLVGSGTHKVDLYWSVFSNTGTAYSTSRNISAREI